ncbi:MAG: zf-HC2 domain-containing protein [Syntrophomonadaceae bacterium]|nr:zf-HC2 domain-containing protein [Syntrophomonadaceae bacterium]
MKCDHMRNLFSPYVDGMCNPQEKGLLEEHLNKCPACRQEFDKLQILCAHLADMSDMKAPEGFADAVRQKVWQENIDAHKKVASLHPKRGGAVVAAVAAAVLLGFFASGLMPDNNIRVALDKWLSLTPAEQNGVSVEALIDEARDRMEQEEIQRRGDEPIVTVAEAPEVIEAPIVIDAVFEPERGAEPETVAAEQEPRQMAHKYSSKIKIDDAGKAIQSLYTIGENYGVSPMLVPTESTLMSEQEDVAKTRLAYLWVAPEDAEAVLAELAVLGFATPEITVTDRTDELEEVADSLLAVERVLTGEGKEQSLSAAHKEALESYYLELLTKQTQTEQSVNLVTIELVLLEMKS